MESEFKSMKLWKGCQIILIAVHQTFIILFPWDVFFREKKYLGQTIKMYLIFCLHFGSIKRSESVNFNIPCKIDRAININ